MSDNTDFMNQKATCWSLTAFDKGEQDYLAAGKYPEWVDRVYGGLEECPDTKRIHFQGAVTLKSQQRGSAMKKFLPKANWQVARKPEALKKYAMKAETSAGDKLVRVNATPYYTLEMLLKLIAITRVSENTDDWKSIFWQKIRIILVAKPYLVGALMKPDVIRAWEYTRQVWVDHMTDPETNQLLGEEAIVLQPPQANGADVVVHIEPGINLETIGINGLPSPHQYAAPPRSEDA